MTCVRGHEGVCDGRVTIEHVFGRKYEAAWNCILLCERHHSIGKYLHAKDGLLNKEVNRFHAYKQATDADLKKFKLYRQMMQEKEFLLNKYSK